MNPTKEPEEEWKEEAEIALDLAIDCYDRDWVKDIAGQEKFSKWLKDTLSQAKSQGAREALEMAVALSDKIEMESDSTEFNEWRAFKGFRNELRDILQSNLNKEKI